MNHTHHELDIFRTYLDINEIPHDEQRWELAHHILHQQHRQIITFHQRGFIFYYFDQFVKEEITLEQFMTMGDIEWSCEDQINPYIYKEEHRCYLDSITPEEVTKRESSDIIIVDKTIRSYYTTKNPTQTWAGQIAILYYILELYFRSYFLFFRTHSKIILLIFEAK